MCLPNERSENHCYNRPMPKEKVEDWQFRKNSLRLKNFDYAARHSNFVTIVTEHRQTFFTDERIANAAIEVLLNLRLKYRFNLYSYCLRDSPKSKKRIFNKLDKLKNVRQVNKLAYYEQPNLFNMFN